MDRLEEIRQRTEAATPGPWYNFDYWMIHREPDVEHNGIPSSKVIGTVQTSDADFIAHSREDIPYLLSEVDRLGRDINVLTARAEAAEAERDAAVADMHGYCKACINAPKTLDYDDLIKPICRECNKVIKQNWQWRGPQEAGEGETE